LALVKNNKINEATLPSHFRSGAGCHFEKRNFCTHTKIGEHKKCSCLAPPYLYYLLPTKKRHAGRIYSAALAGEIFLYLIIFSAADKSLLAAVFQIRHNNKKV